MKGIHENSENLKEYNGYRDRELKREAGKEFNPFYL